jgi:hypothetical protein
MNTVFEFIGILTVICVAVFAMKMGLDYEAREAAKRVPRLPVCPTVEVPQEFPTDGVLVTVRTKRPACVWG